VKEVLCDIIPMNSCHLLLRWAWLHFTMVNLDERSLYLKHEGHEMKLKFITPRQGDEGLTPTKDGGTCLRRLSMFRKEVD